MLESLKDQTLQPGTWNLWTTGKRQVLFGCPKCGQVTLLNHGISDDGTVTSRVRCGKLGCVFHDYVRLVGWTPQLEEMSE